MMMMMMVLKLILAFKADFSDSNFETRKITIKTNLVQL